MRQHLPVLPTLIALTGALLAPIVSVRFPRAVWPLAVTAAGLAAGAAALGLADVLAGGPHRYAVGGWAPPWGIELVLDPLSAFMATLLAGVAAVSLLASGPGVRASRPGPSGAFFALALVVLAGLLGIVASGDLFNVFVFLEITALASYALVASGGGPALVAAFRYLVLGSVGASFYLLGVGLLYAATGTLNMADLASRLPAQLGSPLYAGGLAFIVVGLALKMGLFPLHGWLPDAYTFAPPPVAAFLAPLATKASAYALMRALLHVLRPPGDGPGPTLAGLALPPAGFVVTLALGTAGALAILVGGVVAARQHDARRLLAYSSVSQMGYVAVGLAIGSPLAIVGTLLHILNHALAKAGLFLTLQVLALRGRGPGVGGLGPGRAWPVTATCAMAAGLSLVGIPPLVGFFSKWYLLRAALAEGRVGLAVTIVVGGLLAAVYVHRLTEGIWFGAGEAPGAVEGAVPPGAEAPGLVLAALLVLAAGLLAAGIANAALVHHILRPAAAR